MQVELVLEYAVLLVGLLIALLVLPKLFASVVVVVGALSAAIGDGVVDSFTGASQAIAEWSQFDKWKRATKRRKHDVKKRFGNLGYSREHPEVALTKRAADSQKIYELIDKLQKLSCRCTKIQPLIADIWGVTQMCEMASHPVGLTFRQEVTDLREGLEHILDSSDMTKEDDRLLGLKLALEAQRLHCGPSCCGLLRCGRQEVNGLCGFAKFMQEVGGGRIDEGA